MRKYLLVAGVAAIGLNLRAAIASLPPVFPELQDRLHLSATVTSVLAATPVLCFGVGSAAAAWLSRRVGEERVMFTALGVLAAGLTLRGLFPGSMLFPGTIVAAAAIAVMNVLLSSLAKRRWPERAGLLIGIYLTSMALSSTIASAAAIPLYRHTGGSVGLTLGWWALPAAASMLVWLPQVRRRDNASGDAPPATGRVTVYRHALAWQVTVFMGVQSLLYYAALSWLPTMFRDRGASPATAGNLLALTSVGSFAFSLVVPVLAQRRPGQRWLMMPSVLGLFLGLAGALYAPVGVEPLVMIELGACQGAAFGLALYFTMARAPDPAAAASLSGLAQGVGYLAASAGTLAIGLLHTQTGGWTVPGALMLALAALEFGVGLLAARARILPFPATASIAGPQPDPAP
jgi:CP family cyanate transporter-like MFS transporter